MPTQTKKITLDTAAIFFGKVVGLIFGVLRLNYISSYLGVVGFGILNFGLYFCSLFQVLFDFGISQLITRDISRDISKSREIVGRIIYLKIIIVFFAGLIIGSVGMILHFNHETNMAILLTTIVFAINGISIVFLSAFQAHRRMTIVSLSNIFNDLILSVMVVILIKNNPHVIFVLVLSIIVALLNLAILIWIYIKNIGFPYFKIDRKMWQNVLKESMPIAVSSLGISMYTFVGPTVLKYTRGDVEVGIFSAAYKLISIIVLIPVAFAQVVYPIFSDFFINAKEKLIKALQDSLRIISIISFPIVIGTILLSESIFKILYSSEFFAGAVVLRVTIFGCLWSFMNAIILTFWLAVNEQKFLMRVSVSLGIIMTVVSIIVVPIYGYISLPIILIVTDFLNFTFYLHHLAKTKIGIVSTLFMVKPFAASLLMGVIIWCLSSYSFFVVVPLGILVYFIFMLVIKGFGEQEKEILRRLFNVINFAKNITI